jgi:hypothetical protein
MGILIGMDEAGYGPNFGPLVVAATAWEVADEDSGFSVEGSEELRNSDFGLRFANGSTQSATRLTSASSVESSSPTSIRNLQSEIEVDLYRRLRNIVAKSASERRIAIADSKVLYHPGAGLRQLERGVHSFSMALRASLTCWSEIVNFCAADHDCHHHKLCWHDGFNCTLPVDATTEELSRLAVRFARACETAGVRPVDMRARLVFPAQFNELVEHYGTKGAALSHITVGLLREVIDSVNSTMDGNSLPPAPSPQSPTPIYAVCDKHGGRNYYTALLQHHFSEHWIEPVFESHTESRYEWGSPEARVSTNFRMNGERFLPTALASMTAKYLRELAMRAFNEFWCARVPNLRPTAGYPMDSHRYRKAIAATQRELGIEDHVLWRNR